MAEEIVRSVVSEWTEPSEEKCDESLSYECSIQAQDFHKNHNHQNPHGSCNQCQTCQVWCAHEGAPTYLKASDSDYHIAYQFSVSSPSYETPRRPPKI